MAISNLLFKCYANPNNKIRSVIRSLVYRLEGGEFYSRTLRKIFRHYHLVEVGMYTHGGCFTINAMAKYTSIGRYCSIAQGVKTFNRNHPVDFKSTHAFFFNPKLGYCKKDIIPHIALDIGNDVWIGANALIYPNVEKIGNGAVIAAGAVVNKDVPPYAVVVGNPGRIVRYRFSKAKIDELLASAWWEKSIGELKKDLRSFQSSYEKNRNPEAEGIN